jgi:hypothetical protein
VQPGQHQHVKHSRFAEAIGLLAIQKTAIAKQHGASNGGASGRTGKHRVHLSQQGAAKPLQPLRQRGRWAVEPLQQSRVAQRGRQINILSGKKSLLVERAGIAEIARHARARKHFHAIAGAQRTGISRLLFIEEIFQPQAAAHGPPGVAGPHFLQIEVVTQAPRKRQRVGTRRAMPSQRLAQIQTPARCERGHIVGRNRQRLQLRGKNSQAEQCQKGSRARRIGPGAREKNEAGQQSNRRHRKIQGNPVRKVGGGDSAKQNSRGDCGGESEGWKLHGRRESRTKASI